MSELKIHQAQTLMTDAFNATLPNTSQQMLIDRIKADASEFVSVVGLTPAKVAQFGLVSGHK